MKQQILIPDFDHSYRLAFLSDIKVVYNYKYYTYTEYHGEEYLEEGDIVITMSVVQ